MNERKCHACRSRIARTCEEKLFRWQKANPSPRVSRGNLAEVRGEKFVLPFAGREKTCDERPLFCSDEITSSTRNGGKIIAARDSQSSCYIVAVDQRGGQQSELVLDAA